LIDGTSLAEIISPVVRGNADAHVRNSRLRLKFFFVLSHSLRTWASAFRPSEKSANGLPAGTKKTTPASVILTSRAEDFLIWRAVNRRSATFLEQEQLR